MYKHVQQLQNMAGPDRFIGDIKASIDLPPKKSTAQRFLMLPSSAQFCFVLLRTAQYYSARQY